MNRKIKSGKEVKDEIRAIFESHKNVNELVENLNSYLNNLTGKELIKVDEIRSVIYYETLEYDKINNTSLKKNNDLRKLSSNFDMYDLLNKHTKKVKKVLLDQYFSDLKKTSFIFSKTDSLKVPFDIILTCKDYEKYLSANLKTVDIFAIICKENPDYRMLFSFLNKNEDVSKLLNKFIFEAKQKQLVDLIINKIAPLNTIFVYFDNHKNIKENTNVFYEMLKKKFPRNIIQSTITRDLKKIKEGKFSVPLDVLDEPVPNNNIK